MHHIDLILARQLLGILRIKRHIRLSVIGPNLDRPIQKAASVVQVSHGKAHRMIHGFAIGVEDPRGIQDRAKLDRIRRAGKTRHKPGSRHCCPRCEEMSSVQCHVWSPVGMNWRHVRGGHSFVLLSPGLSLPSLGVMRLA